MSRTHTRTSMTLICLIAVATLNANYVVSAPFTLDEAVLQAQSQDPWVLGSFKRQESLEAQSIESGALPDPSVSVGIANLPIDSFDFAQEPMTQFKVGVSQRFPRGKTLSLQKEKLEKLSQMQPFARQDRNAQVAVTVSQLWLDVYRYSATIELINKDRSLFEYLVDVTKSSYTTASGKTRQQDLVRALLELTRLDDRLTALHQQKDVHLAKLGEWLPDPSIHVPDADHVRSFIELIRPEIIGNTNPTLKRDGLGEMLSAHPKIKQIDQKIRAFNSNIKLAKQSYKPQWGLNASYGYRDQTPTGEDRSDFFSVGVTFDVPLFTANRQDKKVQSATAEQEFVKTQRALMLRQLKSGFERAEAQYRRLIERKSLFDTRLLREIAEQSEASLSAYTQDDGDFAEVVRARIAELNARIEALNIDIDLQKTIAQVNYFHTGSSTNKPLGTRDTLKAAGLGESVVAGDTHD